MKNTVLIILSVLIVSISSYAQNENTSIGLTVGTGIPIGAWGKKDFPNNKYTGFANQGLSYAITFSYKFDESNFGLIGSIGRQTNTVDSEKMAEAFSKEFLSPNVVINSDNWRINRFLLGGSISKPITDRMDFDFRILLGVANIASPSRNIFDDELNWISSTGDSSTAFACALGTGLKYHVFEKIDFLFNVDFHGSKPRFNVDETSNIGFTGNSIFFQEVISINFSLGFAVKL